MRGIWGWLPRCPWCGLPGVFGAQVLMAVPRGDGRLAACVTAGAAWRPALVCEYCHYQSVGRWGGFGQACFDPDAPVLRLTDEQMDRRRDNRLPLNTDA